MGSALSWDPLSLCAAPANTSTAVSSSVRKEEDAWEVEQAMLQEALYQSMEQEHFAALDEQADAELQAALQQSLQPVARQESEDFPEERLRLLALLEMLGLRRLDVGSTNINEGGELLGNQCFYLAIARSWLANCAEANGMLVRDSALQLKREIETCVLLVRGDQGELGDEAEAYTDYLGSVVQSGSPAAGSAIGDLAICVFASGLGGLEAYEGTGYARLPREQQVANLALLWHRPGHFEAIVALHGGKVDITLSELIALAEQQNVSSAVIRA
ncbi:unnamed protein product [Effrenium voratum]|uniref:Uncharacterized protein n=1 Tax=Effrenium voratum TaxID=2562239 RepID=A0AA36I237_9DINO|nr:unnamed protein product [Effrenium voratum]CAJ1429627.1 unnamed protein product [Effrenium voratum]